MDTTFQSLQKIKLENIDISTIGKNLIYTQIGATRSNLNLKEGDGTAATSKSSAIFPPLPESYCHTFYRILGLPVIHQNKTDFYNPGFYGKEDTAADLERRKKIDAAQDDNLIMKEIFREQICNDNYLSFTNAATKVDYRLDMMSAPMPIIMLGPNIDDPFANDKQTIENFPNRKKFTKVSKILRPFKCVPAITNNIFPTSNKICAPFIIQNEAVVFGNTLTAPYLEFVSRVRFASDVSKTGNSDLYQSLIDQMSDLNINGKNILSDFSEIISGFSDVEAYIFFQLFISFLSVCVKVKELIKQNTDLANQIYTKIYLTGSNVSINDSGNIQLSSIETQIAEKKKLRAERNFILAQLPVGNNFIDGVRLSNPINCITNSAFISLVQGDINSIETQIKELEQQKTNQLRLFNSINDTSFYVLGEVNGIGLIDIMALFMSLWLLPQDQLVSMFDEPSFNRLYRETSLHNSTVEDRKSKKSGIAISEVIKSMDKTVFNLIKIASDIIDANKTS